MTVLGWKLDRAARADLLRRYPPRYARAIADHITLPGDAAPGAPLPGPIQAEIVGRADDGTGVEAMVVRLAGTTNRPDGSTWHITWSLRPGRRASESNDLIAASGWTRFDSPAPVPLAPARWP